jgi:hypothetical protein
MSKVCNSTKFIFQEAKDHCRWKKALMPILNSINVNDYRGKSFDEVFVSISNLCNPIAGLGMLTIYDITAAICRHNKIVMDKVFIIGNGPKRAVKLLGLHVKIHILEKARLKYVEIEEIISAFDTHGYTMDEHMRKMRCGDTFETFICNWQKTI